MKRQQEPHFGDPTGSGQKDDTDDRQIGEPQANAGNPGDKSSVHDRLNRVTRYAGGGAAKSPAPQDDTAPVEQSEVSSRFADPAPKPEPKLRKPELEAGAKELQTKKDRNVAPEPKPAEAMADQPMNEAGPGKQAALMANVDSVLTVGRGIRLVASQCECEELLIDGHFGGNAHARLLQLSKEASYVGGDAEVEYAEIQGHFEGNLIVSKKLVIAKSGSVSGTTRYKEIIIEAGGQVVGNAQSFDAADAAPGNGGAQPKPKGTG